MAQSRSFARGAVVLGGAMALSNVLGYAFTLIISRSLGPADFGALSALLGLGIIAGVPAGALQISVARRRAHDPTGAAGATHLALRMGGGLLLLSLAITPVAVPLLHLDDGWSLVWLGIALIPMTMVGAYQGVLLGAEQMPRLSALYAITGSSRLIAGFVAALFDLEVAGVVGAVAVAAWLSCIAGRLLAGPLPQGSQRVRRSISKEIARSSGALVGLLLLSNVDVLLARHFLESQTSGYYGLAALFGKVVFWGTQFIALALLPRTARTRTHSLSVRAGGAIAALGTLATVLVALFAEPLVQFTGGTAFAPAATYAVPFTLLGILWALAQVLLFQDLAKEGNHLGFVVWAAVVLEVLLVVVWLHNSPGQLLLAASLSAGMVVIVGLMVSRRKTLRRVRPDTGSTAELVSR